MRIINLMCIILSVIFFCSCAARMKVKVSTADRDVIVKKAEEDLGRDLPVMIAKLKKSYYQVSDINDEYIFFLKSLVEDYEEEKKRYLEKYEAIGELVVMSDTLFYKAKENFSSYNQIVRAESKLVEFYNEAESFLDSESITEAISRKADSKAILGKRKRIRIDFISLKKQAESNKKELSNRLRFHLLGDPMTSFVTKEKGGQDIWNSTYNQTKVNTFMGDADIAILLRKNPEHSTYKTGDYNNNFTIKGVRLDAEDVIEASFKALSQSINLFASIQLAGNNLISNDSSSDFAELPKGVNTTINNLDVNFEKLEKKKKYLDEIRKLLIEKLILESTDLKDVGEDLNNSVRDIKEFWEVLKKNLENIKQE